MLDIAERDEFAGKTAVIFGCKYHCWFHKPVHIATGKLQHLGPTNK